MDRFEEKARQLVSGMTIEEKCSQLRYDSPALKRLGIPAYNWWNEALHGVARAGTATVFPQAIALAATFDDELVYSVADAISTEARAKYNYAVKHGDRDIYKGLTMWSPNVNIFRDPRWGRGQETYGEDPYLTSVMGVSFVKGLQGDGEYLKTAACAKHFAVHSGPEAVRHEFDAQVSTKDLYETYLYSFRKLCEAGVEGFMGAYNSVNGQPSCANEKLMDILFHEWNFKGYFVSDCWAIRDFHTHYNFTRNAEESAAAAVSAGCNINCGNTYIHLYKAYTDGIISEAEIDEAVVAAIRTRLKLGMGEKTEYDDIPFSVIDCEEHNKLSLEASEKSVVLLKNDGILPLNKNRLNSIGVIGPNADSRQALYGNYNGTASRYVTLLEGIEDEFEGRVYYSEGCSLVGDRIENLALPQDRLSEALAVAENSDVVIMCLGLDATVEGEEGDTGNSYAGGDKNDLYLPESQRFLLNKVLDVGKPVVVVLSSGSSLNIDDDRPKAVLQSWYSGSKGGKALAEILFGKISPSGKLPVTFYKYAEYLPDFKDYSMANRTYRYCKDNVLYGFGYGLTYSDCEVLDASCIGSTLHCTCKNNGNYDTDEVVEVYCHADNSFTPAPNLKLCGFRRIHLKAGKTADIAVSLSSDTFECVDDNGRTTRTASSFTMYCGFSQPDDTSVRLTGHKPVTFKVDM